MEEDVEIKLLLQSNEDLLMSEASKLEEDENDVEDIYKQHFSNNDENSYILLKQEEFLKNNVIQEENNEASLLTQETSTVTNTVDYNDEVQELLDDHIVSYMVKEPTKHVLQLHSISSDEENYRSECESDEGDQFINEIMSQSDQYGGSFMEHVKKVIGNKDSQIKYSAISELTSAHRLIIERDHLLKRLEHTFLEKLYSIEEDIQNIRNNISFISVQTSNNFKEPSFCRRFYKSFGAPYFKDSRGFSPLPNIDHAYKLRAGNTALIFIKKPFYWTKDHRKGLLEAIKKTLIIEKSNKLKAKINKLKQMIAFSEKSHDVELLENLTKCQRELSTIHRKSLEELMVDENERREFDWMKYSVSLFDGEHSPDECRRFWEVFLKPSVRKSDWEYAEDMRLLDISTELKFQDWDSIAKLLGTNRSAFQCFVHFQTRLNTVHNFSKGKWSKEEDEKLLKVINDTRIGSFIPWTKVACVMGNRNHVQVYNRFMKSLDPKLVKGKFTKGEDLLITAGIEVFGCNYKEVCSLLTNRTYGQVRERYERYLFQNTIKVGTWTLEEDEQLLKLVKKHGEQNWVKISKEMKFRTRTQTRQRYKFIQENLKTKPGWTINNLKRRKVHVMDKNFKRTRKIVEKIKQKIHLIDQTFNLTKIEKDTFLIEKLKELKDKLQKKECKVHLRRNVTLDHSVINKNLTEFFKNHTKAPESNKIGYRDTYNYYFEDIKLLAKNFGHQLQIPDNKDEILNNPRLNISLKNVLIKTIEMKTPHSRMDSTPILSDRCEADIDYISPESDSSIIDNDSWFTPSIDISHLNFSEFFKPTVFDFSCGMHKDIWKVKMKQPDQINLCSFAKKLPEPPSTTQQLQQLYNMPPSHLTTLCYKSALLSRTRLKHDSKKYGSEKMSLEESENNSDLISDFDLNNHLDVFQETLLSLFKWPRALSLCNISTKAEQLSNFQGKGVGKFLEKSDIKRHKEITKINSKQVKSSKNGLIKNSNVCKRKMKIEHLLTKVKKEDVKPYLLTKESTVTHSEIIKPKKLKSNNKKNISCKRQ